MLESRIGARYLTAFGFALFAIGLGMSAFQPRVADFNEMFWPQVIRGVAIMFCLLPPTRIALGSLAEAEVADASGLFNLMRNLGGAIGIALIDTILFGRGPIYAEDFRVRLLAGDITAATAIGLDPRRRSTGRRAARRRGGRFRSAAGRKGLAGALCQRGLGDARLRRDRGTAAGAVRARTVPAAVKRELSDRARLALRRWLDQFRPRSG